MSFKYISHAKQKNFLSKFTIVSVFVKCDDKFLVLKRKSDKSEGNKWAGPAGKFEESLDKTIDDCALRELQEETGIIVNSGDLKYLGKHFVRYPDYDFIYHKFEIEFLDFPDVVLDPNEAHNKFKWVDVSELLEMNLVLGENEVIGDYLF